MWLGKKTYDGNQGEYKNGSCEEMNRPSASLQPRIQEAEKPHGNDKVHSYGML